MARIMKLKRFWVVNVRIEFVRDKAGIRLGVVRRLPVYSYLPIVNFI